MIFHRTKFISVNISARRLEELIVALDEFHFKDLLLEHAPPPPAIAEFTVNSRVKQISPEIHDMWKWVISSKEVLAILSNCYYQVTSVRTPRQVVDALNAEGPDIDIILAEVNLPIEKDLKMLKYIMQNKDLRRIPIIMMSAQDEVSVFIKSLRLGASDYLMKLLRTNELLNLLTHMWRRRRMIGLTEKILNYDFDLVASDSSDVNTNSTILFSDDTGDKSRKSHFLDVNIWSHREEVSNDAVYMKPSMRSLFEYHPNVPGPIEQIGN
ncbi:hypothetical protein GIB67_027275 [Kingdonia uniflora]|uniref:Response regulatory domain-containing protein n=1 Tax=Kingdonia uniflora TaxID=39325 RepID=A0A7J7KYG2_9MAGN|nr:hypothetical protein GIB67_027275 [Kingdonia uniflora]